MFKVLQCQEPPIQKEFPCPKWSNQTDQESLGEKRKKNTQLRPKPGKVQSLDLVEEGVSAKEAEKRIAREIQGENQEMRKSRNPRVSKRRGSQRCGGQSSHRQEQRTGH